MPPSIEDNGNRVRTFILEKQINEIELAWDLRDVFNTNERLIGPLRQMASFAIDELSDLKKSGSEGQKVVTSAWQGEVKKNKNKTLIKYGKLSSITNNVPTLSAEECSDIIRLYGEVVEKGKKTYKPPKKQGFVPPSPDPLKKYADLDTEKDGYRKGGKPVWKVGRRDRTTSTPSTPIQEFIHSLKGGISCATLRDSSTVLRLDRVFGLMEAADISGTTTDSIFFIDRYAGLFRSQFSQYFQALDDPIYHLLALATLVAGGHHSLVESALSLTLNKPSTGIDYKIGLYTSLMPQNTRHPGAEAIRHKLSLAENSTRNRLMLVYYDHPNHIDGCYLFAKNGLDRMRYSRLARAGTGLLSSLRRLQNLSPWPSKEQLQTFLRVGPRTRVRVVSFL